MTTILESSYSTLNKYSKSLRTASLEVTRKCNLRCKFCYNTSGHMIVSELTINEIKSLISNLGQMHLFELTIGGGEPLLRDDLFDIVKYATDQIPFVSLTSNGVLIDDNIAAKLANSDLYCVQVALHGSKAETHDKITQSIGSFQKTLQALENLSEKLGKQGSPKLQIATVVNKINYRELYEIADIAKRIRARFGPLTFMPAGRGKKKKQQLMLSTQQLRTVQVNLHARQKETSDVGGSLDPRYSHLISNEHLETKIKLSEERGQLGFEEYCPAGRRLLNIEADGTVTPCPFLPLNCGNIREKKLEIILKESDVLRQFREMATSKIQGKCSSCKFLDICGGGCRAAAYHMVGNIFGADPNCWYKPLGG